MDNAGEGGGGTEKGDPCMESSKSHGKRLEATERGSRLDGTRERRS